MAKISVIVPVYNTANYIERCLDSLINQTIKNEIEIIIINDGSTDKSEEVIQNYIERQEQKELIKYFSKSNEGIAKTRNFGIEKANCDYILFVDSDDYIDNKLVEKLMPYINKNIDLIKFKLQRVDSQGEVIEKVTGPVFDELIGEEAFSKMYSQDILLDSPCVYIMKKDLFEKNNFKFKQTYHEDFGLIPLILLIAKSVVSTDYYLYYYVQVENSITRNDDYQKTVQKMQDCLAHYDNMINIIEKINIGKRAKEDVKIYYTNAILLKLKELNKEERKYYEKQIRERKMQKNIRVRNLKQLIKRILLQINIELYLKMK